MNSVRTLEYSKRRRFRIRSRGRACLLRGRGRGVGTDRATEEKQGAYECGFEPYDDARRQFNVRYYQVAIRFLVFDLEVCYMYPWVRSREEIGWRGYRVRREFRRELVVGYAFVWIVGTLEWE